MRIDEAIRYMVDKYAGRFTPAGKKAFVAERLGIEALKLIEILRADLILSATQRLPGETRKGDKMTEFICPICRRKNYMSVLCGKCKKQVCPRCVINIEEGKFICKACDDQNQGGLKCVFLV